MNTGVLMVPLARIEIFSTSYLNKTRALLFLLMIVTSVILGSRSKMRSQQIFVFIEVGLLMLCMLRALIVDMQAGLKWDDTLEKALPYLYPLMAFPLINLFCTGRWKPENCARILVIACTVDTLMKTVMSFFEARSGVLLWPNLVLGSMGYRNGLFRINPCALTVIVIPLGFWLLNKADKMWEKLIYLGVIGLDLLYAFVIWQARSALMYKTIILVVLFFLQRTTDKKRIIRFMVLIIGIIIFVNTPVFNNFVDSFSASDAEHGGSTVYRIIALDYFIAQYFKDPIWGTGLLDFKQRTHGGTLEDLGFLYGLVQLGIPMIAFYAMLFSRSVYVAIAKMRRYPDERLLLIAMPFLFVMFGINIDTFYMFGLTVPFFIAFVEYNAWVYRMDTRKFIRRIGVYAPLRAQAGEDAADPPLTPRLKPRSEEL